MKRDKISLPEATVNSGFHLNGFVAVLPQTRLKVPFTEHIADQQWWYTGKAVRRVHVEPVTREPHKVTDYAMKTMKRGSLTSIMCCYCRGCGNLHHSPWMQSTKALKDIQSATNISDELARAVLRERGVLKVYVDGCGMNNCFSPAVIGCCRPGWSWLMDERTSAVVTNLRGQLRIFGSK